MENDRSAHPKPQNQDAVNKVFWDVENCYLTSEIRPEDVYTILRATLNELGYTGDMTVSAAVSNANHPGFPEARRMMFSTLALPESNIEFHDCMEETKSKNVADRALIKLMVDWTRDNPPPANILLISGDEDFLVTVNSLVKAGYNVMLGYRPGAAAIKMKISRGTSKWTWGFLLNPPQPRCKKPDGGKRRRDDHDKDGRKGGGSSRRSSRLLSMFSCFGCFAA